MHSRLKILLPASALSKPTMTPFKFEQLPTELQQKVLFDAILSSEPLFYFNPPNEVTDSKLAKRPQCLRTRFNLIMSLVLVNKSLCLNMFEVLKIVMAENDKTMARLYSALPMASTQTHKAQEAYDCLAVTYHLPLSLFPAQALKVIHRRKWRNRKQKGKVMGKCETCRINTPNPHLLTRFHINDYAWLSNNADHTFAPQTYSKIGWSSRIRRTVCSL